MRSKRVFIMCVMLALSCRRIIGPEIDRAAQYKEISYIDKNKVPFTKNIFGEDLKGLQTRVYAYKNEFNAGDPIIISVEIRNNGNSRARAKTDANVIFLNGHFTVRDSYGNCVRCITEGVSYYGEVRDLDPGQSEMVTRGDITRSFYLYKPGNYSIQYPHAYPYDRESDRIYPSNIFLIRVLPPKRHNPLLKMLGRIIEDLPRKWEITVDGIIGDAFREKSMRCIGKFSLKMETEYGMRHEGRIDLYINIKEQDGDIFCEIDGNSIRINANDLAIQKWPSFKNDLVLGLSEGSLRYEEDPTRGIVCKLEDPDPIAPGRPGILRMTIENHEDKPFHANCTPALSFFSDDECVGKASFSLDAKAGILPDGKTFQFVLEAREAREIRIDLLRLMYSIKDVKGKDKIKGGFFEGNIPRVFTASVDLNPVGDPGLPVLNSNVVYLQVIDKEPPPIQGLRLILVPNKEDFMRWGPVGLTSRLINESDRPVTVCKHFEFPYRFFISIFPPGSDSDELDFFWESGGYYGGSYTPMELKGGLLTSSIDWRREALEIIKPVMSSDFVLLNPGEALEKDFELESIINGELSPGIYSVQAFYRNYESGEWLGIDPPAKLGIVKSNTVRIKVH